MIDETVKAILLFLWIAFFLAFEDVATGHELLSESSGLYLRNLAFDTQGRFDNF